MTAAALALAAGLAVLGAGIAHAEPVWGCDGVGYDRPLGDGWGDLVLLVPSSAGSIPARLSLAEGQRFVGLPVCGDLDGDDVDEIVTVEVDLLLGPQIVVYGRTKGRIAASLPKGDAGATMAVQGVVRAVDQGLIGVVEGDGRFRVWALAPGRLVARAVLPGYAPGGGVRDCGAGREWVLARADGSAFDAIRWSTEGLVATRISEDIGDISRLMTCEGD